MKGSKSFGRRTGQICWSKTWGEGFREFGRRRDQRFCSKTWHEGFKEFGKEKGSNKDCAQRLGIKGSKSLGRRTGQRV